MAALRGRAAASTEQSNDLLSNSHPSPVHLLLSRCPPAGLVVVQRWTEEPNSRTCSVQRSSPSRLLGAALICTIWKAARSTLPRTVFHLLLRAPWPPRSTLSSRQARPSARICLPPRRHRHAEPWRSRRAQGRSLPLSSSTRLRSALLQPALTLADLAHVSFTAVASFHARRAPVARWRRRHAERSLLTMRTRTAPPSPTARPPSMPCAASSLHPQT